jgi:hypothetical protein
MCLLVSSWIFWRPDTSIRRAPCAGCRDLRKNHGKEEARARDLFYALWIPDLFMQRVEVSVDAKPLRTSWQIGSSMQCWRVP